MATPGYIYLIRLHQSDNIYECPYKIGKSITPDIRHKQLGILMPYETSLIHKIKTDDMESTEWLMHTSYEECRMNGEWFRMDEEGLITFMRHWECNWHDMPPLLFPDNLDDINGDFPF